MRHQNSIMKKVDNTLFSKVITSDINCSKHLNTLKCNFYIGKCLYVFLPDSALGPLQANS